MTERKIFVTGGTGYVGSRLIARLLKRGHAVKALARRGSEEKLPEGCQPVVGDALQSGSFAESIRPSDTFVQLVGVPHPSPSKAKEFQAIDLASARASVTAALSAEVSHFIYVSVAQPAPVMKAYQQARAEAESLIREAGFNATILRPWYVLGPGHRWPHALIPMYWTLERISSTRETALRLGLVKLDQMVDALVASVEMPGTGIQVLDVPAIKEIARSIS
jgi:uncharacterized protein YbjT (DUF2867 family)